MLDDLRDRFREDPVLFGAVFGGGLLVVLLGSLLLAAHEGPPPPMPPAPPPLLKSTVTEYRYTEGFYRALITEDAKKASLPDFDPAALMPPNRFGPEFRGSQLLAPGRAPLQTEHLKLSARVEKLWVGESDTGYRAEHLLLRIENKSDRHLAYVVETSVGEVKGCAGKGDLPHNAIALRPGEAVERSECLSATRDDLRVRRVDVLELTALGYHYVSRLSPAQIGLDLRTGTGHVVPGGRDLCRHVPGREVKEALAKGRTQWVDVMDFYSRHNCDEYWFFEGYRLQEQPLAKPVPARPSAPESP